MTLPLSRALDAAVQPDASATLTKATLRVSDRLGLSQFELAQTLGLSAASVSRLMSGSKRLAPESKEGELALYLVRVFRSLDALVGGSVEKAEAWFSAQNRTLAGVPRELVKTIGGLVHVAEYLDAMRGKL